MHTVKLNVHDIASIPADGLHYWIGVPVGSLLAEHREKCKTPKIANIRAFGPALSYASDQTWGTGDCVSKK